MTSRINNRPTALCIAVIVLLAMTSCETVTSFVRELRYGQVVAKVGSHRLYASELASYIPDSASPEDSTRLALQYINTWASDQLFTDVAERELSKSEKNVDSELEDYRHSLLKYRYEQKYVNQRLDTAVTKAQIEKYYDDHAENFKLSLPIAKAVYMNISADSPNLEIIKKKMRSDKPEARIEADSIAFACYRISYPAAAAAVLEQYNALETAPVEKHSKRGKKIVDLKEHIPQLRYTALGDTVQIELCLPASQELNLNPSLLTGFLEEKFGLPAASANILRTEFLTADRQLFA